MSSDQPHSTPAETAAAERQQLITELVELMASARHERPRIQALAKHGLDGAFPTQGPEKTREIVNVCAQILAKQLRIEEIDELLALTV